MSAKLSVNINDETRAALVAIAEKRGTTVTDIVRRATSVYKFLDDAQRQGDAIELVDPAKGTTQRVTFL